MLSTPSTTTRTTTFVYYGIIAVLVLLVGYLMYRSSDQKKAFQRERDALQATVRQRQLANDKQQLMFGMKTFAWAVRNAMIQNKTGEINEYFNTLVKDRGIKEMLLVDDTGTVLISTNKKNQGIPFASRFPGELLQREAVSFADKRPYELSAPVTAPNKRLGTLVMFYNPATILPDSLSR